MEHEDHQGKVILLGIDVKESLYAVIEATGRQPVVKQFWSLPSNWEAIINIANAESNNPDSQVLCRITERTLFRACLPQYIDVFARLCEAISDLRHQIYMYQDNLEGQFNILTQSEPDYMYYDENPQDAPSTDDLKSGKHAFGARISKISELCSQFAYAQGPDVMLAEMARLVRKLAGSNLQLVPYSTTRGMIASAQTFLREGAEGLIMRLYLPNEKLWGEELDRLLTLFQDYLVRVGGMAIRLSQTRTQHGTSFNFYSHDQSLTKGTFSSELAGFNDFLSTCMQDPDKAEAILRAAQIPDATVRDIVTRYSRDARRIVLDMNYARKRAIDDVEYRLKSELLDIASFQGANDLAQQIIYQSLPNVNQQGLLTNFASFPTAPALTVNTVQINNAQFIASAQGIIAGVINGNITYNEHDNKLIDLIDRLTDSIESVELKSALDELKDTTAPATERQSCWQKLQGFVRKHSGKIEDITVKVLSSYLEKLLTGK
jgi:hypothetical protein